jgi:hypothetical protein
VVVPCESLVSMRVVRTSACGSAAEIE